jgi:predicted Zn-dependent protease
MTAKFKKSLLLTSVLGILLIAGGFAGYRGYKSARQHRLIRQTRAFLAKADQRKALLTLQRALKYNSRDLEACRLMAELAEAGRSPSALLWRSRVVEIKPHSTADRLALAQTALIFNDYASATNALDGVDFEDKKRAAYHNVAGAVESTVDHFPEAEWHFLEACRIEPQNALSQLNLAVVRLHNTNTVALAEARTTLKTLSSNTTNSTLRCQALRELVVDAMRFNQTIAALALSRDLLEQTNSLFRDRILRLEVLRETRNPELKTALIGFQREATVSPSSIYEMGLWQMSKTSPAEALTWLQTLPMNTQTNQPVAVLIAECFSAIKDWSGLHQWLRPNNQPQYWGELEFIRHSFETRALRGQELAGAAKAEWEQALKAANGQKGSLVMLLRMAAQWNWLTEAEELLWAIVNRYPDEKWAAQALSQSLLAAGRTRPLMQLYSQQMKRAPSDLGIKNNLAMTALLLEAVELKPHQLAREIYDKAPTNTSFVSTYAFSLHVQDKDAEALKIIQKLSPQDLENPSIAGYYGLILKATGNAAKAKIYLNWASKAPMLPEERKLFERARTGV